MRLSFSSGRSHFDKTMQVNKQLRKIEANGKIGFFKSSGKFS
jgi:hypothetical protein